MASRARDKSEVVPNEFASVLFPFAKELRLAATFTAVLPKINAAEWVR
jgi:hypothetical protein